MVNDAALELLGLEGPVLGRRVVDVAPEPDVAALLQDQGDASDVVLVTRDRVLVLNRRRAATRGEGVGTVVTMRDRTELVEVQQQLGSNLTITDALRAQTHEFANQLHTIGGLLELDEPEEARALVTHIVGSRAARQDDLADHVEDPATAALLLAKSSQADEAGVLLSLDPDCEIPPLGTGLAADVTTILGNLVDNAGDACRGTPGAEVRVTGRADDDALVLEVEDSGDGVPAELRSAVFVRGYSTKPDVLGGRGVGLATEGFEVVGVAANGEEAIALCAALDPDLVLLDVHLPDLGGLQVLARLREAGSRAGVIMVTAERDADTVRAAVAGGAMQYVVKPFEQHDLAERLHRVRNALLALGEGDADQATIDRAFGAARSPSRVAPLPKGLSRETAQLVEGLLEQDEEVSSSDAAERLGLSRVTARRYLEPHRPRPAAGVRRSLTATPRSVSRPVRPPHRGSPGPSARPRAPSPAPSRCRARRAAAAGSRARRRDPPAAHDHARARRRPPHRAGGRGS